MWLCWRIPNRTPRPDTTWPNRTGCREYLTIRIACGHRQDPWTTNVALFHTNPVTGNDTADPDYNWGEVVRVLPPTTPQFQCLYGARNDTEARHANLKKRLKYLPHNINAQQTRLYGAMIAANALAWQKHLQAHGQGNVIDNTA